jgi:hypothetical protein
MTTLPFHAESSASLTTPAAVAFALLDDHLRLSAHMTKRSWMMAGSRMSVETDAYGGKAVGSRIRLSGRILGIRLALEEVVTERTPPSHKIWETVGEPRLLVIGSYRMGFQITPTGEGCSLVVHIDYARPESGPQRWLGRLLGDAYARWCVRRMTRDARGHLASDRVGG